MTTTQELVEWLDRLEAFIGSSVSTREDGDKERFTELRARLLAADEMAQAILQVYEGWGKPSILTKALAAWQETSKP